MTSPAWFEGFVEIPMPTIVDPGLTDGAWVTLAYVLARVSAAGGTVTLTHAEIARHRRTCERTVRRHVAELASAGYLEALDRPGEANRYRKGGRS